MSVTSGGVGFLREFARIVRPPLVPEGRFPARLVVAVNYRYGICYVRFVGTHKAYNRIDVATV
jgi:hypothetical protein